MDNYSPPPPASVVYPAAGLWCPRKLCRKARACNYAHSCKAMTSEVAAAKQAEWEVNKLRREKIVAQEVREAQFRRERRNHKINAMLEAHDLSLYELEEWVKDVQKG